MSKTPKIEDVFRTVQSTVKFDYRRPQQSPRTRRPSAAPPLPFAQVLDFAFPGEITDSKVVQVGEIIYVGDGVVHVIGLDRATIDEIIEINTATAGIQRALILGILETRVENQKGRPSPFYRHQAQDARGRRSLGASRQSPG